MLFSRTGLGSDRTEPPGEAPVTPEPPEKQPDRGSDATRGDGEFSELDFSQHFPGTGEPYSLIPSGEKTLPSPRETLQGVVSRFSTKLRLAALTAYDATCTDTLHDQEAEAERIVGMLSLVEDQVKDPQVQFQAFQKLNEIWKDPEGKADSSWMAQRKGGTARANRADEAVRRRTYAVRFGHKNKWRIVYGITDGKPEVVAIDSRQDIYAHAETRYL